MKFILLVIGYLISILLFSLLQFYFGQTLMFGLFLYNLEGVTDKVFDFLLDTKGLATFILIFLLINEKEFFLNNGVIIIKEFLLSMRLFNKLSFKLIINDKKSRFTLLERDKIKEYLYNHPSNRVSIKEIGKELGYSTNKKILGDITLRIHELITIGEINGTLTIVNGRLDLAEYEKNKE